MRVAPDELHQVVVGGDGGAEDHHRVGTAIEPFELVIDDAQRVGEDVDPRAVVHRHRRGPSPLAGRADQRPTEQRGHTLQHGKDRDGRLLDVRPVEREHAFEAALTPDRYDHGRRRSILTAARSAGAPDGALATPGLRIESPDPDGGPRRRRRLRGHRGAGPAATDARRGAPKAHEGRALPPHQSPGGLDHHRQVVGRSGRVGLLRRARLRLDTHVASPLAR